ncbi:YjbF family lipoprotein [Mesobacterium sp. TK19101]|uniref:YjbF family lipoprotein n=1 Tax=Mesobacterium hydrothermale TaxID=3111907 RepID=A0ABU6HFQ5_9RHOB|nr:YjbF family lipoprotein [Mesobacterium sp. TK19101]MEC3861289.1 YjbF family lipoprotein [Mesobacterium sp. TK19101]
MKSSRLMQAIAAAAMLGLLAGCGNDPSANEGVKLLRGAIQGNNARKEGAPALTQDQLAGALQQTGASIAVMTIEDSKTQTLLAQIETNGAYRTYANSSRQSATLRNGIITATRGLGGDVMSSETDSLVRHIASRLDGTVPYTLRFLDGEEAITEMTYVCTVTRGEMTAVAFGEISANGRVMRMTCSGTDLPRLDNFFVVEGDGTVVASHQWVGEVTGYVTLQHARR